MDIIPAHGAGGKVTKVGAEGGQLTEIEGAFLALRPVLLNFVRRLGALDCADDILQEMWIRLPREEGVVRTVEPYLYRMAHSLVIDWKRSAIRSAHRDKAWADVTDQSEQPRADRALEARETATRALAAISLLGERVVRTFKRHRIDGLTQREVAVELGVSIGTVEGDLRRAYSALDALDDRGEQG
ncbi:MAG: RNA polymerase sigma factor [Sphingomonas phyllosphaerae]